MIVCGYSREYSHNLDFHFLVVQIGAGIVNDKNDALFRRLLAVSPWTVAGVIAFIVSVLWAVSNMQRRAAAYQNTLDRYSEQVQGTVTEHDASTTISATTIYIGNSPQPQSSTMTRSTSLTIAAKYVVDGKEYEVTGDVRDRSPRIGDSVTVYYAPGYPANCHLQERLHYWAQGSADRYVHPVVIYFVGTVLSVGLWYYGYWQSKRRRVASS